MGAGAEGGGYKLRRERGKPFLCLLLIHLPYSVNKNTADTRETAVEGD